MFFAKKKAAAPGSPEHAENSNKISKNPYASNPKVDIATGFTYEFYRDGFRINMVLIAFSVALNVLFGFVMAGFAVLHAGTIPDMYATKTTGAVEQMATFDRIEVAAEVTADSEAVIESIVKQQLAYEQAILDDLYSEDEPDPGEYGYRR